MSWKHAGTVRRGLVGKVLSNSNSLACYPTMVKARLPELQCPGVECASRGKAYPTVVGEVVAHQAEGRR